MSAFYKLTTSKIISGNVAEFENLGHKSKRYTNFNFKKFLSLSLEDS